MIFPSFRISKKKNRAFKLRAFSIYNFFSFFQTLIFGFFLQGVARAINFFCRFFRIEFRRSLSHRVDLLFGRFVRLGIQSSFSFLNSLKDYSRECFESNATPDNREKRALPQPSFESGANQISKSLRIQLRLRIPRKNGRNGEFCIHFFFLHCD